MILQAAVWVVAETDLSSAATHRLTVQYNTVSQCSSDMLFCSEQPSNADSLSLLGPYYTNSPKLSSTQQTSADFDILNRIPNACVTLLLPIAIHVLQLIALLIEAHCPWLAADLGTGPLVQSQPPWPEIKTNPDKSQQNLSSSPGIFVGDNGMMRDLFETEKPLLGVISELIYRRRAAG